MRSGRDDVGVRRVRVAYLQAAFLPRLCGDVERRRAILCLLIGLGA